MRIAGSTVLLTGAAGGIGQTAAHVFASKGAKLILSGRNSHTLEPLAAELGARFIIADLADPAHVERLASEAGEADILIANAALPASGVLLDYTPEQITRALAVNLHAPILLSRLLAPRMVAVGSGHLALIGSIAGKVASPATSLYNATKFGLRGFAHSLRQDLHGTGVGVSIVQPGFVRDAGMFADSGATLPATVPTVTPQHVANAIIDAIENNRGEVDVAPLVVRLAGVLGGLFPQMTANTQRRFQADRTVHGIVEGQRHKR